MQAHRYFVLNKPIHMVSQFVSCHSVKLLCDLDFAFPPGTHAIGRLDQNSEGLLLLTTNKKITKLLFQSVVPHKRTYLVQVQNNVIPETLIQLANGIAISAPNGSTYITTPCEVIQVDKPSYLWEAADFLHANVQNSWLQITLTEGKFHQVRKMVAAVNHKCIRLIRTAIEEISIVELLPGAVLEMKEDDFLSMLHL